MTRERTRLKAVRTTIRVLIVDDHALFAEALMLTLGIDDRIEVVGHAPNGREALVLARTLRPDVVLMDLHMPGMDGIETTKALARVLPTARVVMVTASNAPHCRQWAREAGAIRYVTKDTAAMDLLDTVVEVGSRGPAPHGVRVSDAGALGRTG